MAGEWEPVGQQSKWEPVGKEEPGLGANLLGSADAVLGAVPRMVASGLGGLAAGAGALAGGASLSEAGQELQTAAAKPFGPEGHFTEQGPLATEAMGHYGMTVPGEVLGDLLAQPGVNPAVNMRTMPQSEMVSPQTPGQEAVTRTIGENILPVAGVAAMRNVGKPRPEPQLSPEAQKYLADKLAAEKAANPWEPVGKIDSSEPTGPIPTNWSEEAPTNIKRLKGDEIRPINAEIEGALTDLGIPKPEKPNQFPMRNEGDMDFPFRQEALERDPHIYDLREQYQEAVSKGELRRAKAILADAENYLDSSYNIRSTLGPLYKSGEGTALPIESVRQGINRESVQSKVEMVEEASAKSMASMNLPNGFFNNNNLALIELRAKDHPRAPYIVRDGLNEIIQSSKIPFYKELAKLLLKDKEFNPSFDLSLPATDAVGRYSPSYHAIRSQVQMAGNEFVLIHEALHGRMFAPLEAARLGLGPASHPAMKFANRIKDLYNSLDELSQNVGNYGAPFGKIFESYGFTANQLTDATRRVHGIHEFASEGLGNPEFQLLLKQAPLPKHLQTKGARFYWDAFVQSLGDLLGLKNTQKNQTYLSALLEAGVGLMQATSTIERTAFVKEPFLKNHPELGSPPRDPKIEAFKNSLPEALKGEAKQLYKEYIKQQEPRPEVVTNENALTAAKDIPGMKDIFAEVAPIEKSVEELKPFILKEEDLGGSKMAQLGRQMVAGVKLLGFGSQNTVIRFGGQMVDNALRRAEKFMREEVTKKDTGLKPTWEKLTSKEQDSLWPVMIAAEGKEVLSQERLLQLGMSDKQIAAYGKYRSVMDRVLANVNEVRQLLGKKPIEPRQGFIMSRFLGDFKIDVLDPDGKRFYQVGATTQWGAERAAAVLKERYPNYTYTKVKHEPTHRIGSTDDVNKGYQALLGMLDEQDPRVAALESTMQEFINDKGYDALGYKRHFIPKSETPVKGFEGNKEWLTQRENTRQGLHASMVYIDQAMRWAELQKANQHLKQLLTDKDITEKQPNATEFIKNYFDQAAGRSKGLTRAIDTISDFVAENTGIGHSLQTRSLRETKQFFTSLYLGFWNLGFSASQILQPVQMMPPWLHYLRQQGATKALPQALAMGMRDAIWYGFNNDKMTPFGREAMKHADEYGITDAHFLDDVRSINESKVHDWYTKLTTYNMTAPEKVARRMTYLMFSHFLHANDMPIGKRLFETAANLTDMSMVDYRLHERANMYKMLGVVGESASALTTFKHNYYSQMWALGKRGGSPVVANMIGMTMLFAGLMGFYGREEVDAIINLINEVSTKRVPTLTETILKTPDTVAFGGLSAATGLDMSPKFSMSNIFPDNLSKAIFPFGTTSANVATLGAGLVNNPTQSQGLRIMHELAPGPVKALTEGYFSTPERTLNPKTMEGKYDRNTFEKAARFGSVRSIKESRAIQENYQKKNADAFYVTQRQNIAKNAKDLYFEGKMSEPKWKELANNYVKNEGKVEELVNEVVSNLKDQKQSEARRTLMESLGRPTRYKRLEDMTQGGFKGTSTSGWQNTEQPKQGTSVSDSNPQRMRWMPQPSETRDRLPIAKEPGTKDKMPMLKEDDLNLMIKKYRT